MFFAFCCLMVTSYLCSDKHFTVYLQYRYVSGLPVFAATFVFFLANSVFSSSFFWLWDCILVFRPPPHYYCLGKYSERCIHLVVLGIAVQFHLSETFSSCYSYVTSEGQETTCMKRCMKRDHLFGTLGQGKRLSALTALHKSLFCFAHSWTLVWLMDFHQIYDITMTGSQDKSRWDVN